MKRSDRVESRRVWRDDRASDLKALLTRRLECQRTGAHREGELVLVRLKGLSTSRGRLGKCHVRSTHQGVTPFSLAARLSLERDPQVECREQCKGECDGCEPDTPVSVREFPGRRGGSGRRDAVGAVEWERRITHIRDTRRLSWLCVSNMMR
jgi:hypothetical protein